MTSLRISLIPLASRITILVRRTMTMTMVAEAVSEDATVEDAGAGEIDHKETKKHIRDKILNLFYKFFKSIK